MNGTDAVADEEEVGFPIVGTPGLVAGVTAADGAESLETPAPLFAVTVNV